MAKAGAISRPSTRKSTEAISQSTSFTRGVVEGSRARPFDEPTQIAAAPSVSGEELPAVSVPLPLVRSKVGRQPGELLQRGVLARDGVALRLADRDHQVVEEAVVPGRRRRC